MAWTLPPRHRSITCPPNLPPKGASGLRGPGQRSITAGHGGRQQPRGTRSSPRPAHTRRPLRGAGGGQDGALGGAAARGLLGLASVLVGRAHPPCLRGRLGAKEERRARPGLVGVCVCLLGGAGPWLPRSVRACVSWDGCMGGEDLRRRFDRDHDSLAVFWVKARGQRRGQAAGGAHAHHAWFGHLSRSRSGESRVADSINRAIIAIHQSINKNPAPNYLKMPLPPKLIEARWAACSSPVEKMRTSIMPQRFLGRST